MLKSIPTSGHLGRLYFELGRRGAPAVGRRSSWPYRTASTEALFCLACDMSRYDPRLMTVLVRFLDSKWRDFNPVAIRSFYPSMRTPQTAAVMAEFLLTSSFEKGERSFFLEYLQRGLAVVPLQFYFHHLYPPGGYLAERVVETSLAEYKKWGFLARESPVVDDKERKIGGHLDKTSRLNVLRELLREKKQIKMGDYLAACQGSVSRQQALIDLKTGSEISMKGRGRGAFWVILKKQT